MSEPALAGARIETELQGSVGLGSVARREQRQLLWGLCGVGAGGHTSIIAKGCDRVVCEAEDQVTALLLSTRAHEHAWKAP